jgi:tetratricopeptide (TPR) repeat protein
MAKIGRNDPCPCGSGKKYKRCHLDGLQPVAVHNASAQPSGAATPKPATSSRLPEGWTMVVDDLDELSNSAVDLVQQGRLVEAEQVALRLLRDYPDVNDGFERLAMVHEARGDLTRAAEMYQRALDFTIGRDGYDEESRDWYRNKLAKLARSPET